MPKLTIHDTDADAPDLPREMRAKTSSATDALGIAFGEFAGGEWDFEAQARREGKPQP